MNDGFFLEEWGGRKKRGPITKHIKRQQGEEAEPSYPFKEDGCEVFQESNKGELRKREGGDGGGGGKNQGGGILGGKTGWEDGERD